MAHSATLSLHSADKTLIEFLNAKDLGCKISSSDSVFRGDRGGFSHSQLNVSFYANGYEFMKKIGKW